MSILELKDVRYTYRIQYQQVQALKGISCSFEEGKLYAIMGKSGSGKTTLLSLMAGLDLPSEGEVLCHGVSTARMDLERYRREQAAVSSGWPSPGRWGWRPSCSPWRRTSCSPWSCGG